MSSIVIFLPQNCHSEFLSSLKIESLKITGGAVMQILYYRKFRIYYEECCLISIESVKYGIEHIRLYPSTPVPPGYLYFLVDKLIEDSEAAFRSYCYGILSTDNRRALMAALGSHLVRVYGGNTIFPLI